MDFALKTLARLWLSYIHFNLKYSTPRLVAGVAILNIILHTKVKLGRDSSIRRVCRWLTL